MFIKECDVAVDPQFEHDAEAENAYDVAGIKPNYWRGAKERLAAARAEAEKRAIIALEQEALLAAKEQAKQLAVAAQQRQDRHRDLASFSGQLHDAEARLTGELREAHERFRQYRAWRLTPAGIDAELGMRETGIASQGHFLFGILPEERGAMEQADRLERVTVPNLRSQFDCARQEISQLESIHPALRSLPKEAA